MLYDLIPIILAQAEETATDGGNPLIDWTTVIAQVVNFLILLALLRIFLYKRIVDALNQRRERIKQEFDQAEQREAEATEQKQAFQQKQKELEDKREQMINDAEEQAEKRRKQLLDQARQEVDRKSEQWHQELTHRRQALLQELRKTTSRQACRIARRVVTELADAELEARMVGRFVDRLKSLDDTQQQEITDALGSGDSPLVLASAFELDSSAKGKLTKAVHQALGTDRNIDYTTDDEVICGLELRVDGYEVAWSADEYLDSLEQQLGELIENRTAEPMDTDENDESSQEEDSSS